MSTETIERGLTQEQLALLLAPIHSSRIRQQQGQSHLEAWDVRRWLTRIFGFGGWEDEILSCECVHSVTWPVMSQGQPVDGKHRCTAVYRVTMRLTVKDPWGNVIGRWEDGATGDSVNQPSVGDAHDMALKTAMSQALKRCAMNLGDQFGLSLYNNGDARGVVLRTAGHPVLTAVEAPAAPEDAPVIGGELDEPREATDGPQHQVAEAVARKAQRERRPVDIAPRERNPFDDDFQLPASVGRPATDGQLQAIAALCHKKRGITGRQEAAKAARLEVVASIIGRRVASSKELTLQEASQVIDRLTLEPDHMAPPPPAGPEAAALAEAEKLGALPDLDPAVEEEIMRDQIESAGDPAELERVMAKVFSAEEAGVVDAAAFERLRLAGTRRQDTLKADQGWSSRRLAERGLAFDAPTGVAA